jgi:hypothetical protein
MKKILFVLFLTLFSTYSSLYAAETKVSALPAWTTPIPADYLPIVDSAAVATKKITLGNLYKAWKGYLYIPAGGMIPDTSSGLLQKDSTNIVDYLAFDGATDEAAMFSFSIEDWDLGTIKAKFVWGASSEDNAQTCVWCLTCYAVSDGDTYDVALTGGPQCAAADALGADSWSALKQHITAATGALTVQGTPAAGDVVYCKVYRDVSEDDYEHDAWLFGIKIEYGKVTPTAW